MSATSGGPPVETPTSASGGAGRPHAPGEGGAALSAWKKLAIWAGFLALVYLARDFFFTAFMTFLFSYLTLAVVGWGMRRLSPGRDRPGLRRLLTVGFFVVVPLLLLGVGVVLAPRVLEQGQRLAGWMSQVSPETEVTRLLEDFVGPYQFRQHYHGPEDPKYKKDLEEFKKGGVQHVEAYNQFPDLEAWVEAGFSHQFTEQQRQRTRARLIREGASSKEFAEWFVKDKYPELKQLAGKQASEKGRPPSPAVGGERTHTPGVDLLVRGDANATPEQLLVQVRRDPSLLPTLREEWIQDTLDREAATAKATAAYREQFQDYYEQRRAESPESIPYTYEQYEELQKVRPRGPRAFGEALEKLRPTAKEGAEARLRADFEAAKKHELFREWWSSSSVGQFIRRQLEAGGGGENTARLQRVLYSFLNVPVDLGTALILSFFICIDFPNLRDAFRRLRDTWLRDVYDEVVPALANLGHLVGRAMRAQGMIALCNATLIFIGLVLIGVEHAVLLSCAVFVLCLVPTLGAFIALVLIAVFALVQPGGGLALALKAGAVVLLVVCVESFVLSPRILGKMMELHPVLVIAILPLAQYFFGVWGLILAVPVAVYVIDVIILRRGVPGSEGTLREGQSVREGKS